MDEQMNNLCNNLLDNEIFNQLDSMILRALTQLYRSRVFSGKVVSKG